MGHAGRARPRAVASPTASQQKAWFCGPPAHVIEGIKSIEAKYPGLEDFMMHWAEGLSPARVQGAARAGSRAT